MIHHSGKQESKGERGSSALRAALDTAISSKKSRSGKAVTITLTCEKQKDTQHFQPIYLTLKEIQLSDTQSSAILIKSASKPSIDINALTTAGPNERKVLEFFVQKGNPEKSEVCMKETNISPSTFYRALNSLCDEGCLKKDGENKNITYQITEEGIEFAITLGLLPIDFHGSDHSQLPSLSSPHGGDSSGGDSNDSINTIIGGSTDE